MSSCSISLAPEYRAEFACKRQQEWNELLSNFSDASLYQTWDYDAVRCGERNLDHLVLKHGDEIVAVAQARLAQIPGLRWGAAYVRWGPLWRRGSLEGDVNAFRMALRALRNEYVCRRGLVLRIFPLAFSCSGNLFTDILVEEQFVQAPNECPQQTLLVNIEVSLDELKKGFNQKWRNCLNHAERNQLAITHGTGDALFEDFIPLYKQMVTRKGFTEPNDINEFKEIQRSLPEPLKMGLFLCTEAGALTGGVICSAVGDTGLYLFGATNAHGLKNKGAYLLQWHALQWMKNQGCKYYNLNGINPVTNPGSYHFKAGLAGKCGQELRYLGRFDCYGGVGTRTIVRIGLRTVPFVRRVFKAFRK